MSTTSDYLSRKIGDLGCEIAANRNKAKRLDMEHEHMAAELREVEAAYAAVEALDAEEGDEHAPHRSDDMCRTMPCPQYAPGRMLDLPAFEGAVIRGTTEPTRIVFAPELQASLDEQIDQLGKRMGRQMRQAMGLATDEEA
jgi:hypothetical protein